jgi:hypothetical protein
MNNDYDWIRRGDVLAEVKKSSDNARAKMAKADSLEDLSAWSAVASHADIVEGAIAALPGAHMGVKPLEWDAQNMARDTWGNYYEVTEILDGWKLSHPYLMEDYFFTTEGEAKAAAKADYKSRILAALTPQPKPSPSEEQMVQAAYDALADRRMGGNPTLGDALELPEIKALVEQSFFEGFHNGKAAWGTDKMAWEASDTLAALQEKGGV